MNKDRITQEHFNTGLPHLYHDIKCAHSKSECSFLPHYGIRGCSYKDGKLVSMIIGIGRKRILITVSDAYVAKN